jgi:hypothetical protein
MHSLHSHNISHQNTATSKSTTITTNTTTNTNTNTATNTDTNADTNTDANAEFVYTNINTRNTPALLRTLLIMDLVILDKLYRRSNLSLLLIHLRTSIDNALDSLINTNNNLSINVLNEILENVLIEFNKTMSIIFKNHAFFHLSNLAKIYQNLQILFLNNDNKDNTNKIIDFDFDDQINQLLSCSESMSDFLYFNGIFNKQEVLKYENEKLHKHYSITAFKNNNIIINNNNNNNNNNIPPFSNEKIIEIVKSKNFIDFHLQRWEAIGLLDTHIFKPYKKV